MVVVGFDVVEEIGMIGWKSHDLAMITSQDSCGIEVYRSHFISVPGVAIFLLHRL